MTEEQKALATDSPPAEAGGSAGGGTGGGAPAPPGRTPSPFLSFLFALVPGVGHMYMGLTQKGIQLMVLFFGSLYLSQHLFLFRDFWPLVVAPATWFYSFFDALETSRRLGQNEVVEDRPLIEMDRLLERGSLWGWILIVLGGITLMERIFGFAAGRMVLHRFVAPIAVPLVILACGVYLLMQQRSRGQEGTGAAAPEPAEPTEPAEPLEPPQPPEPSEPSEPAGQEGSQEEVAQ